MRRVGPGRRVFFMVSAVRVAVAALALAMGATAGSAWAQAQPFKPVIAQPELSMNIGGGVVYGFSPTGGKSERLNFTPWGDFNWRDRIYGNPLDGLGYNVVKSDRVRAGVQIRPHYSGQSTIEGLELPDLGADLALYGFVRAPGNISIGGRVMRDIRGQTDGTDYYVSVANQSVTPVGLLVSTVYLRGGDARSNNAYLGVDEHEAAVTGLETYMPGAGLQNVGVALMMMTPIGDKWAVGSFVNAERALGDVADSPLIQARKREEMAYRGGVLVVRRLAFD